MNTHGLLKCGGAVVALAIVSACAGGSNVAPSAPSGATVDTGYRAGTLFLHGRPVTAERLNPLPPYSELVPEAAKSKTYEYIFNSYQSYASIFDYPKSINMVGMINGAGGQGCTNVLYGYGKNTFWNAGRTNDVMTEYQVPSKQIKTLPIHYDFTSSCAMNTSGDLAVGILLSDSYGGAGQEVIFKNASGKGIVIPTPLYKAFFAGYDTKGNLWADGENSSYEFQFVEIPKGAKKGVTITTSNSPSFPGSVQWDGKYMTVFDQGPNAAYQYAISGTKATLKNTVQLNGASDCAQTWIVPGLIYCADAGNNVGEVFKYPAGGSPVATFNGSFDEPLGTTAAEK
jgi:hypothetical protein